MQFHLQYICWCHLYMRWGYLCTVDRCVPNTYSICMKLDMLVSKNVVSTCKVLFVNLVLCWPAVSWGPNPSCNFTLDHVYYVWIFCKMCHFHILELLREKGSREELCLITNDSTFCVVALWYLIIEVEKKPFKTQALGKRSSRISSCSWKTKRVLIHPCMFSLHQMPKKCKSLMKGTELHCRSLPKSPSLSF